MDNPNAFIGKTTVPTAEEIAAALGKTAELWTELVDWLAEQGASGQEWKAYSSKSGWSLRLKVKKRNIIYLSPCSGHFRVGFIFGDKAVAAARQSNLSQATLKLIDEAPHYPEGTGLLMMVKAQKDLAAIRKLALIKLAN
jgi:hypothetical protein